MSNPSLTLLLLSSTAALVLSAFGQSSGPSLPDTLQFLKGAAPNTVAFSSDGCQIELVDATSTLSRFDLADIDPDAQSYFTTLGIYEVKIHTTNYAGKIRKVKQGTPGYDSGYTFDFPNADIAQRYAQALHHAAELCGGKPSAF
jgi:hypothetical protein